MIDWITAIVPCSGASRLKGGQIISLDPDGCVEWQTEKRLSVEGSFSATVQVRAEGENLIWISGNPAKFLQGHNLFGSNSPRKLVCAFLDDVAARLGLGPSLGDRLAWRSGSYRITRIDIAECFRLPSTAEVDNWIRAASSLVRGKHQQVSAYGGETIYIGKQSRRLTLKIYNKAREIRKHKLPADIPLRGHLAEFAEGLLRVELCLRSLELKKRALDRVEEWEAETAAELLRERIGRLEMPEKLRLTATEHAELPPRLRGAVKLWESGHDLRSVYPKATFYRYRTELRKYGIDIAVLPQQKSNVVPLFRFLEAERQAGVPEWALGTKLIACAG